MRMNELEQINYAFGDGFSKLVGIDIVEWSLEYAKARIELTERHLNPVGILHGGVIASGLDMICGLAGNYCTVKGNIRTMLTVSLTTNFVGRATSKVIWLEAHQISGGRSLYTSNGTIKNDNGDLIATATGTFKWGKGSHLPEGVPTPAEWRK
ncbi:MAG: aromatic compounds catabolism protein [Hyphomicrobiales bacterium]|nr:MAG: aromatic compounds catabolism protein [Hyphomicrobiales bacterium]